MVHTEAPEYSRRNLNSSLDLDIREILNSSMKENVI